MAVIHNSHESYGKSPEMFIEGSLVAADLSVVLLYYAAPTLLHKKKVSEIELKFISTAFVHISLSLALPDLPPQRWLIGISFNQSQSSWAALSSRRSHGAAAKQLCDVGGFQRYFSPRSTQLAFFILPPLLLVIVI